MVDTCAGQLLTAEASLALVDVSNTHMAPESCLMIKDIEKLLHSLMGLTLALHLSFVLSSKHGAQMCITVTAELVNTD